MVDLNSVSPPSSSLLPTSFCFVKNLENCGTDMDTLLYLTWRTSKALLDSAGTSAQCHIAAWIGGEFGGEWIHVYV